MERGLDQWTQTVQASAGGDAVKEGGTMRLVDVRLAVLSRDAAVSDLSLPALTNARNFG